MSTWLRRGRDAGGVRWFLVSSRTAMLDAIAGLPDTSDPLHAGDGIDVKIRGVWESGRFEFSPDRALFYGVGIEAPIELVDGMDARRTAVDYGDATTDERAGIDWWAGLQPSERRRWMEITDTARRAGGELSAPSVADVWALRCAVVGVRRTPATRRADRVDLVREIDALAELAHAQGAASAKRATRDALISKLRAVLP